MSATPLYPFGYGLSYTDFTYETMTVETTGPDENGRIKVDVTITNTGNLPGTEVVQLYIRDKVSSYRVYDMKLAAFERVTLDPGQSACVTFFLDETSLSYYSPSGKTVFEDGEFEIMAGSSSADIRLTMTI